MRYIVDLLARYQSAFGLAAGIAMGTAEGLLNGGIFKAGIAYNDARWELATKTKSSKDYDVQMYAPADWSFAEMVMKHEDVKMNFAFGGLTGETDNIFAPPPLARFRRTKNIGVTVVDGGDEAEIVENFGINSWEIDLNGILVDMDEHAYPGEKVQMISDFFAINDIIDVACPLFMDMGIKSIYFKEQSIEPVEGYPDSVKYTLTAKSIKPALFSLILKE